MDTPNPLDVTVAQLLEGSDSLLIGTDRDGLITYVNQQFTEFTGYTLDEIEGTKAGILLNDPEGEQYQKIWQSISAGDTWYGQYSSTTKDGRQYWVNCRITPIRNDTGEISQFVIFQQLAPSRQMGDEEIESLFTLFSTVFDQAEVGLVIFNKDLEFVRANPFFLNFLGYTWEEFQSLSIADITYTDDKASTKKFVDNPNRHLLPGVTKRYQRKDGTVVWGTVKVSHLHINDTYHVLAVIEDVTERIESSQKLLQLQERIMKTERMNLVSQLIGQTGHDFKNLLQIIMANVEMLSMTVEDSDASKRLNDISSTVERAKELVNQILHYGRDQDRKLISTDIHELIRQNMNILAYSQDSDITFHTELQAKSSVISADENELSNVLINLIMNAIDAMNKGLVRIKTRNVHLDNHEELPTGDYLAIDIIDTGKGIAPEIRDHLFQPFHSTKSKGTGLGLASSMEVVKRYYGTIELVETSDQGTRFRILLPLG